MELRELEAFVAVATELHFGRAAERLYIGQPTLSELVRRLERELGTPLLARTTRRVALTEAGGELLARAKTILGDLAAATTAVGRIAAGESGTVRVGMTPPVAPVLAPHLSETFAAVAPAVEVVASQLWLPTLARSVAEGTVDVALTCGRLPAREGLVDTVFCSQPLLVGLRPDHRLAAQAGVRLADLAHDRLGATVDALFPAWAAVQREALATAGIAPPEVPLPGADLSAARWLDTSEADWILLIGSLAASHTETVIVPVVPRVDVPFSVQWNPARAQSPAVARFVQHAVTAPLPAGWSPLASSRLSSPAAGLR